MNYKETYQEWLSNPYFDEDTKKPDAMGQIRNCPRS